MEELVEEAGRGIWAVVRFVLWHVLFELVLFNIGRVICLAFTIGQFPRSRHLPRHQNLVGCVGIVVVVVIWSAIAVYNRTAGVA